VRGVIEQFRTKLLDLTGRNALISFRHSERSRSNIRVVDEIPEKLFGKLDAGKQLFFHSRSHRLMLKGCHFHVNLDAGCRRAFPI